MLNVIGRAFSLIGNILRSLLSDLVSFDVKSLFTNVPLDKMIKIIMDRIYKDNVISTPLKQRTLKKLIKDTCSKTLFMLDDVIYEQIDGVIMGASLGPALANIIMADMERKVVDELIQNGKIKFYARYVDDTLLLVKPDDVNDILQKFNSFHENLESRPTNIYGHICHIIRAELSVLS